MAKKAKKRAPARVIHRRQSRVERQRRLRNIIVWSVAGVAVVVVGLLLYGLVIDRLVKQQQPVAIVNGVAITVGDVQARAYLYNKLYYEKYYGQPISEDQVSSVVELLIQDKLVRQEAERRKIVVTPEEVRQAILARVCRYNPESTALAPTLGALNVGATPVPSATPVTEEGVLQTCDASLREEGIAQGTSDPQLYASIEEGLLREALREEMGRAVATAEDQVQLRYIVVDTPEDAGLLLGRLEGGTPFETIQEELEAEESASGYAVDAAWYLRDELEQGIGPEIAARAFDLEATGMFTQTVVNAAGSETSYVVEVVAREVRVLSDGQRQARAGELLNEWLDSQMILVERLAYNPADLLPAR